LSISLNVDVKTVISAAAVFGAEAWTVFLTPVHVYLLARDEVRAIAILVLDYGKCICSHCLATMIGAVAIRLVLPGICLYVSLDYRCSGRYLQTASLAVFCGEQYEFVKAATVGAQSKKAKRMAMKPKSVEPDLRNMIASLW
jgi:hypothetical protein